MLGSSFCGKFDFLWTNGSSLVQFSYWKWFMFRIQAPIIFIFNWTADHIIDELFGPWISEKDITHYSAAQAGCFSSSHQSLSPRVHNTAVQCSFTPATITLCRRVESGVLLYMLTSSCYKSVGLIGKELFAAAEGLSYKWKCRYACKLFIIFWQLH